LPSGRAFRRRWRAGPRLARNRNLARSCVHGQASGRVRWCDRAACCSPPGEVPRRLVATGELRSVRTLPRGRRSLVSESSRKIHLQTADQCPQLIHVQADQSEARIVEASSKGGTCRAWPLRTKHPVALQDSRFALHRWDLLPGCLRASNRAHLRLT